MTPIEELKVKADDFMNAVGALFNDQQATAIEAMRSLKAKADSEVRTLKEEAAAAKVLADKTHDDVAANLQAVKQERDVHKGAFEAQKAIADERGKRLANIPGHPEHEATAKRIAAEEQALDEKFVAEAQERIAKRKGSA